MKKILILAAIFIIMPFATFAHGAIDDGDTATQVQETMMTNSDNMMSDTADHAGGAMSGGMMGGNMMWMNLLHILLGITSLVWLIAGVLFLYQQFPLQTKKDVTSQ